MELLIVLIALGAIILYFYLKSPTVIGAAGERRVRATLSRSLNGPDYVLLNDLTLPTADGTTQVDHIVLSRFGIFVVETKNMSGWIFGGKNQARWTQVMRRHKSQFQNPLRQNYHHVRAVQDLLGVRLDQISNLVVFVGSAEPRTEMPSNVFWSRHSLAEYISSFRTARFTENEIQGFARKLQTSALEANRKTRREHINHLRSKPAVRKANAVKCPCCSSAMVKRSNKKTGQEFYGCSQFPRCNGTRQIL